MIISFLQKGGLYVKFPVRKKEVVRASLLGLCTGIVGVLFFIILLNSMDSNVDRNKIDDGKKVTTSTSTEQKETKSNLQEETSEQFFANQHGVFSSFDAASEFVSNYASLNTSAIVEIDKNYYVWSQVAPTKEEIKKVDEPPSFVKLFKLSSAACKKKELQELPNILKSNDKSKFYFEDKKPKAQYPSDWQTVTVALTNLSKDLSVVRMHLLAHYYSKNDCLKIEF